MIQCRLGVHKKIVNRRIRCEGFDGLRFSELLYFISKTTSLTGTFCSWSSCSYLELLLLYSGTISFILRTVAISSYFFEISTAI